MFFNHFNEQGWTHKIPFIHFQSKVVLSICLLEKSCVGLAISRHSPPTPLTGSGLGFSAKTG